MQFTKEHVGKRVQYLDTSKAKPRAKFGSIADVFTHGNGTQMLDFAQDDNTRLHRYVWAKYCTLLPEDHPEYDGPHE